LRVKPEERERKAEESSGHHRKAQRHAQWPAIRLRGPERGLSPEKDDQQRWTDYGCRRAQSINPQPRHEALSVLVLDVAKAATA